MTERAAKRANSTAVPWWAGVPPVEATIDCRGHSHRLSWRDGALATPDHRGAGRRPPVRKGDPPGRRGERAAETGCAAVTLGWRSHHDDPRSLVLGRRHPGDVLRDPGAAGDPLGRLLAGLDPALERRLQLEAAAGLAGRWASRARDAASARAVLEAATVGRAGPIFDRWLGAGHRATITLGSHSSVTRRGRTIEATFAPGWLAEVWGRYLSVVDGFLVLGVTRLVEDRAEVVGVGRPGGDPAVLTVSGPAPWRVVSRADHSA